MRNARVSAYREDLVPHHKLLADLISFSDQMKCGLDDIGLIIWDELLYYSSTPSNSIPFATTGGDGVHFGLIPIQGRDIQSWPVVMTVPMVCDDSSANWIVGRDLYDFLCLGCHFGYFALDGIVYPDSAQETIADLAKPDNELDHWEEKLELLRKLRKQFNLNQWDSIGGKLAQLQQEYIPYLKFDEEKNENPAQE